MKLIVTLGTPQTYLLFPGTVFLGRSPENHICILHESVSRLHAQIDIVGGQATLVDRKSTRGTFVNGQRVTRYDLRGGEMIHLGEVACTFVADEQTPAPLPPTVVDLGGTSLVGGAAPLLTRSIDGRATLAQVGDLRRGGRLTAEQKLRTLLQVSQILSGPEPIDALLTKILDLVFQILGVNRAVLLLADEVTGELVPRVARPEEDLQRYSRSVVQYAKDHNTAALFADAARDERLHAAQSVLLMSLQSAMVAPLRARDRLLGVL
ncbi:MAG: FHA domain-containing protein, partial [Polyangiaceae bacterium]|nr:FHA domain-containing protein [Polyangiaceae bacterium]